MFNDIYKNSRVLITGNTGFKGSWLTTWLLRLGAEIHGISNSILTEPSIFHELGLKNRIIYHKNDIRNLDTTANLINEIQPDFVFHLAAQALVTESYRNPIETITSNVLGTVNILESLRFLNKECMAILVTSDKCYDNSEWIWGYRENDRLGGKDIYSGSKAATEVLIRSYYHSFFKKSNIRIVSVRAGNVIGGGDWSKDRIVPDCIRAWNIEKTVEIRSPEATRPWQHALEPLSGYLSLGEHLYKHEKFNGQSFNFGPSEQLNKTVNMLVSDLEKNFINSVNSYNVNRENTFSESTLLKLNCDKALANLKWTSTLSYEQLIEFTGSWYKEFYNKKTNMLHFTLSQIIEYEKTALKRGIKWAK